MTNTAVTNTELHEIDSYVDTSLVENMADKGAFMNIKVIPGSVDTVSISCIGNSGGTLSAPPSQNWSLPSSLFSVCHWPVHRQATSPFQLKL